jgi:RNA polymerase sigma-70 factor (ECF subfamily)
MTDAELQALYDRYAPVLYHRCLSILKNEEDAHDAVQETFARVLRHAEEFRRQSSPLTWMYRISTNHALNTLRNRRGRQQKLDDHGQQVLGYGEPAPRPDDGLQLADVDRLLALLDDADDETRRCVIHTYIDDCTRQETATLVGISVPTVRKRVRTFLAAARERLGLPAQES